MIYLIYFFFLLYICKYFVYNSLLIRDIVLESKLARGCASIFTAFVISLSRTRTLYSYNAIRKHGLLILQLQDRKGV